MEIVSYSNCSDLAELQDAWERLGEQELSFVPSFSELRYHLESSGSRFLILAAIDDSQTTAIACFIFENSIKRYEIATRKLFDLPVRKVSLFGSCVLGEPDEHLIREFFRRIIRESDFDLIDIGEIFIDSPLYRAITSLDGALAWRVMRKQHVRWLTRLPSSLGEYIASLRPTTGMRITRDCRKFEKQRPAFRVTQHPGEVEAFLRDAEKVSRLTYQWDLGYGLINDEGTRLQFTRLAKNGILRCYIAYIRGEPCAFGWGELSHRTFCFRATGYDPQFRKLSAGTALIIRMIRDLIENTNCKIFDFGSGDEEGYKSRLGTVSLSCARMQVARIYRPYSLLIVALDQALNSTKQSVMKLGGAIIGHGALKQRLKSMLRPLGVGRY
jgi:hypothetical protein